MAQLKVIHGSIWHGGKLYADPVQIPDVVRDRNYGGDTIEFDENDEEQAAQMAELRRLKVAARPEELLTAEQAQDLTAENAALKDRQADLERQLAEALAAIAASKSIE